MICRGLCWPQNATTATDPNAAVMLKQTNSTNATATFKSPNEKCQQTMMGEGGKKCKAQSSQGGGKTVIKRRSLKTFTLENPISALSR